MPNQQGFAFADPPVVTPTIVLRPYQVDCHRAIHAAWQRGVRRQLVSMSTGLGKSVVLAHLPAALGIRRMLVLAHRYELLQQNRAHLLDANPSLNIEIEQAANWADHGTADIVVGSVPTLGRAGSQRLDRFAGFDVVIVDEAHHASAESYLRILASLGCGEPHGPLLVGFTATPFRGDGKPLANVFDEVVYEKGLRESIEEEWLCRIRAIRVKTGTDVSRVKTTAGDFNERELADTVNVDQRNSVICSAIEEHAADRRCILVFAVDTAHVDILADQLRKRGHAAEGVTYHTPPEERRLMMARFKDGTTRTMVNCGIFSEGTDVPMIDTVVMAKPTKSLVVYTQSLGRGCRPSHRTGKESLLVIDLVDNVGRHKIQTAATAFGMREIDLLGRDVLEAADACEAAAAAGIDVEDGGGITDVDKSSRLLNLLTKRTVKITTLAEAIEVFAALSTPTEVKQYSMFPWQRLTADHYALQIDYARGPEPGRRMDLKRDARGVWDCTVSGSQVGGVRLDCTGPDDLPPFSEADKYVKRWSGTFMGREGQPVSKWRVLKSDARCWQEAASEKQVWALRKAGIMAVPGDLTKGSARDALTALRLRGEVRA